MTHRLAQHEPSAVPVLLSAAGVHAGYPGHDDVLDCVSVEVARGRRLAVLGANGSGKTTLLRCLSGAHRPSTGDVLVHGEPLRYRAAALRAHRQRVQLVLQDPDDQLFSADVRRDVSFGPVNLGLPDAEVRRRVGESLEALGVAHVADRAVHQLSYGQRKRVAVAGAVAMRPDVLLLDEPTAGLDPHGVTAMFAALGRLERGGTTVVMATHDVDLAWAWADEVAVVVDRVVHQDVLVKVMTDTDLMIRAGLAVPWPVRLLRDLGREIDVVAPPRTSADVAALLR
ncbi:ATP-binding cassette domain-containing protein [Phycicoccus sp. CSK15P-2]|uniref:energy-coupling factor ABC transporter ATP-binding protein n=1 Tax=Phycicoccus sp. CSK15P-2 TaxID=2807627 RepID=UPI001950E647|nr:ATP-binding cassette domain-containing protein [Phycicoccus sp. CSK15P-2]MBM6404209.1 ATP-binding cassette domain-containing protein [Phycicoccus sp. CSK15P-2]